MQSHVRGAVEFANFYITTFVGLG